MAGKKQKRNLIIIFVLVFIIGIAAGFFYGRYAGGGNDNTTAQTTTAQSTEQTTKADSTAPTTENPSEESTAKEQTTATTKKVETDFDLPMNINTALDALGEHYGGSFEINSTVEDAGLNYFSIYKDGEKYASVAVNLQTGDATETLSSNGKKTNFSLVK